MAGAEASRGAAGVRPRARRDGEGLGARRRSPQGRAKPAVALAAGLGPGSQTSASAGLPPPRLPRDRGVETRRRLEAPGAGEGIPRPPRPGCLRRHKCVVMIQGGGDRKKRAPGHLIHCFCSFLVAAHKLACKILLLHFPVHFFGDEGFGTSVGSWEDKTSCPWQSGPIILIEMSSVLVVVQTTAVSLGRLPYKVWA